MKKMAVMVVVRDTQGEILEGEDEEKGEKMVAHYYRFASYR